MPTRGFIRADFAGPGGMSEGLRLLGVEGEVGVEFNSDAAAVALAAGHKRWVADVTSELCRGYDWPRIWLYTATPPCQTFSTAGKGDGRRHLEHLIAALYLVAGGITPEAAIAAQTDSALDARSVLSLEPMLVIREHMPVNIAFEEVPGVLPLWQQYARILTAWGYSVWTGVVTAERYGVPQTRRRAILLASCERVVGEPKATHSRYYSRDPQRLDEGVLPWVSMAQALGFGAFTAEKVMGSGMVERSRRAHRRPAVACYHVEGWAQQVGPARRVERGGGRRWDFNDQSGTPYDEHWPEKRPATAVAGREIVQNPGATANRYNGSTKSRNDGVRVTVEEAGLLQSFRADYPWAAAGTKTSQYQRVGDAVPPLLARAMLGELLGIPFDPALPAYR